MRTLKQVESILESELARIAPYTDSHKNDLYKQGFIWGFLLQHMASDPFLLGEFRDHIAYIQHIRK
jgi:hypothetical protein